MGYAPSNIGRFALKTQSSWGTAETSFAAANYVEASVFIPTPVQEALRTDATRGGYYAQRVVAGSKKDTTFTVSMPMHGFSDSTPSADPGAAHPDALLVAAALGDFNIKGFASSAVTGGTASAPTVSDSDYNLWVGQAVAVTLLDDLSAAPSGSGDLLGSITCYLTNTINNALTFDWVGSDASIHVRFYDCVVTSAKITLNATEQPIGEFTIQAGGWTNLGGLGGGAPGDYAMTDRPQMPALIGSNGSRFRVNGSAVTVSSLEIEITNDVQAVMSHAGTEGLAQYVTTNRSVAMTAVAEAASLASLVSPGTATGVVQFDANTTPGRAMTMTLPSAQVEELSEIGDSNGLVALTTRYAPQVYSGDSGDGTLGAAANTAARIAFL
jgi:hypothetical protein